MRITIYVIRGILSYIRYFFYGLCGEVVVYVTKPKNSLF